MGIGLRVQHEDLGAGLGDWGVVEIHKQICDLCASGYQSLEICGSQCSLNLFPGKTC